MRIQCAVCSKTWTLLVLLVHLEASPLFMRLGVAFEAAGTGWYENSRTGG